MVQRPKTSAVPQKGSESTGNARQNPSPQLETLLGNPAIWGLGSGGAAVGVCTKAGHAALDLGWVHVHLACAQGLGICDGCGADPHVLSGGGPVALGTCTL